MKTGGIMAPFILQASLTFMPDYELVNVARSEFFATWPERNQEIILNEIHERMHTASQRNIRSSKGGRHV